MKGLGIYRLAPLGHSLTAARGQVGHSCTDTLDLLQEQNELQDQPEKVFRQRTVNLEAGQYALKW